MASSRLSVARWLLSVRPLPAALGVWGFARLTPFARLQGRALPSFRTYPPAPVRITAHGTPVWTSVTLENVHHSPAVSSVWCAAVLAAPQVLGCDLCGGGHSYVVQLRVQGVGVQEGPLGRVLSDGMCQLDAARHRVAVLATAGAPATAGGVPLSTISRLLALLLMWVVH